MYNSGKVFRNKYHLYIHIEKANPYPEKFNQKRLHIIIVKLIFFKVFNDSKSVVFKLSSKKPRKERRPSGPRGSSRG